MRRSDKNQRIIGTLLGSVKDNVVEVNLLDKSRFM
jgi:hypothetical protein